MSAESIARWKALPMSRSEQESEQSSSLKRSRPDDEIDVDEGNDDDDDNISLVSRSSSPLEPTDSDKQNAAVAQYDEYNPRPVREVITVETRLKSTNKGFAMLAKLGWTEGQPLGLSESGRVDPIPFHIKHDLTGLGKTNQDVRMIETTVSQRRGMDSERQQKETDEQRRAREDSVARAAALQSEISTTLKAFYCSLCDKQFKNVAQFDEHTNSYAHHHKARFKDMQASQRIKPREEVDKRKEKERKREEKELRKIAAAAGIKMAKPSAGNAITPVPATEVDAKPVGFKKSGWSSVTSTDTAVTGRFGTTQPTQNPNPSGSSTERAAVPLPPPSTISNNTTSTSSKAATWTSLDAAGSLQSSSTPASASASTITPVTAIQDRLAPAPTFRTAGWTSLDTGSSQPFPPPAPSTTPVLVPISQPRWSATDIPPPPQDDAPPPPPIDIIPLPAQPEPTLPQSAFKPPHPAVPVRSGWQTFQQKGSKRK